MRVHLARLRAESSHQVEMGSGAKVTTLKQRSRVRGAGAEHVGLSSARAGVDSSNGKAGQLTREFFDEFGGAGGVASADEHALKVAHQRQHCDMRAGQASSAEDAERGNVRTRQEFRG